MTNPDKFLAATIIDRRVVADDLFVLHVDTGGDFSFLAGQYATLGVEVDSKRIERPYSICSSPYEKNLEFFVERVPEGEFTPILYAMDKGAPLLLRRFANGRFTLDLRSGRKNHFLLATVTGIAPYTSYIRTVYSDWKKGGTPMPGEHRLFCIQGASRSGEFGYRDELEQAAAEALQSDGMAGIAIGTTPGDVYTQEGIESMLLPFGCALAEDGEVAIDSPECVEGLADDGAPAPLAVSSGPKSRSTGTRMPSRYLEQPLVPLNENLQIAFVFER